MAPEGLAPGASKRPLGSTYQTVKENNPDRSRPRGRREWTLARLRKNRHPPTFARVRMDKSSSGARRRAAGSGSSGSFLSATVPSGDAGTDPGHDALNPSRPLRRIDGM